MEGKFQDAVDRKVIPGAVLVATNRDGSLNYSATFGRTGLSETSSPMQTDTTFWIASCTKLMTTIAALQCVERGLFSLDSADDLERLIPERAALNDVITGVDESDSLVFQKATTRLTLRHLLTHTSGVSYDESQPLLMKWRQSRGEEGLSRCGELAKGYLIPLLFNPGDGWMYGASLDWAGLMVERANDGKKLGEFMKENIWGPLGMASTTFHPDQDKNVQARLADIAVRQSSGDLEAPGHAIFANPARDDLGGAGAYSSPTDYIKILSSILRDDGILLKTETITEMFTPQLNEVQKAAFLKLASSSPEMNNQLTSCEKPGTDATWGLGGVLMQEDVADGRKKGTMYWSGLPNLHWWIDRASGVCGLYASQVVPPGDARSLVLFRLFTDEMTRRAGAS